MKNIAEKIVLITGASSGIGEALAREYAAKGEKVMLAARSEERLQAVCESIKKEGGYAHFFCADVCDENQTKMLVEECVSRFGRIDILICNAGISMRAPFKEVDLSVMHSLMDVNFWGAVNVTKHALNEIVKTKGSIVGVSSLAGIHGLPQRSGYSASKYALTGFFETLRIELAQDGVHVMVACPGYTASNIRFSALTADGSAQGTTPRDEKKMMSAQKAAQIIIRDIERKKRLSLLDFEGRAAYFLKKIAPRLLDKLFDQAVQSESEK